MGGEFSLNHDQFRATLDELDRTAAFFMEAKSGFSAMPEHGWSGLAEITQFSPALSSVMTQVDGLLAVVARDFTELASNMLKVLETFQDLDAEEMRRYAMRLATIADAFTKEEHGMYSVDLGGAAAKEAAVAGLGMEAEASPSVERSNRQTAPTATSGLAPGDYQAREISEDVQERVEKIKSRNRGGN